MVAQLFLISRPVGIPPALALATCWRARCEAPTSDIVTVALLAAERGFVEYLHKLAGRLGGGNILELCDAHGMTILHTAAAAGNAAVCDMLCKLAAQSHVPSGWLGIVAALSRRTMKKRSVLRCTKDTLLLH